MSTLPTKAVPNSLPAALTAGWLDWQESERHDRNIGSMEATTPLSAPLDRLASATAELEAEDVSRLPGPALAQRQPEGDPGSKDPPRAEPARGVAVSPRRGRFWQRRTPPDGRRTPPPDVRNNAHRAGRP